MKIMMGILGLGILLLTGCFRNPEAILEDRIARFEALLDAPEKKLVEDGEYARVAASLSKRISGSKEFAEQYSRVIQDENIEFFEVESVVRFYTGSMRARARLFRFVAMLEDAEVTAFNERRFADLASSLDARFVRDSGLAVGYRNHTAPKLMQTSDAEIATDYVIDSLVRPFSVLYRVVQPAERERLAGDEAEKVAKNLRVRMSADPTLHAALTEIRGYLPETRNIDDPGRVFSMAAALALTNKNHRQDLVKISAWINEAEKNVSFVDRASIVTAFSPELARFVHALPSPTPAMKRMILLKRDLTWFALVVEEKIDFFGSSAAR